MPGHIHKPGTIGIISRSGTLTYEAVQQVVEAGLRPVHGRRHRRRPDRRAEVHRAPEAVQGRPGDRGRHPDRRDRRDGRGRGRGLHQEGIPQARRRLHRRPDRPPGRRMGHAGAIIAGGKGTAQEKMDALRAARRPCRRQPGRHRRHPEGRPPLSASPEGVR